MLNDTHILCLKTKNILIEIQTRKNKYGADNYVWFVLQWNGQEVVYSRASLKCLPFLGQLITAKVPILKLKVYLVSPPRVQSCLKQ